MSMVKKAKLGIMFLLTVGGVFLFMAFIPDGEGKVLNRLLAAGINPHEQFIPYHDSLKIRIMTFGEAAKPPLLLIHGSPGDWSAWENIIINDSVRSTYHIIAIDRAGYGRTTVPPLSGLATQADVVWQALTTLGLQREIVVVGHSYGGAVAEQLLLEHPQAFSLAVLAAPTLSPELMAPRWYNKVARWRMVNGLLSKDLRSSNIEMLGLPASLQANEDKLSLITTPIIYLQGKKDVLVPYETVDYFKNHKPHAVKYTIIADMNHFIPWSDPHLITNAVLGK